MGSSISLTPMKNILSILFVLIIGIIIGFLFFAYAPLGFRYEYLQTGDGLSFYRVDRFTGVVTFCGLRGSLRDLKMECHKVYNF